MKVVPKSKISLKPLSKIRGPLLYLLRRVGLQVNISVTIRQRKTFGAWIVSAG
jgi:hypothetical protein